MRILFLGLVILLAGCISEEKKKETTNEEGQKVSDATLNLSGFWDGKFNSNTVRVLIYNGNIYGRGPENGYYGTVSLNSGDQTVLIQAKSYAISSDSDTAGNQYVADGNSSDFEFDTQLSSLKASNDSLFGSYSIGNTPSGNVELTRDGTWNNNSPLSNLAKTGKWTATNHELVMTQASDGVTFTGISTSVVGCNYRGRLENLDTNRNLYRATLTIRENCPAFNQTNVSGLAGFNKDGNLEFYFREANSMLFMTFTPPAKPAEETPTEGDGDAPADPPAAETPAT